MISLKWAVARFLASALNHHGQSLPMFYSEKSERFGHLRVH
jgi:hypothetical protein